MSRYPRSRGFTLVELLVVIAIIGTLVALLLPAVQQAREAARRMSCSNNLHNLAIAGQNYHDSIGSFPSAFIAAVDPQGGLGEAWGWGVLMMPFLEQKNLHTALTTAPDATTNRPVPVSLAQQFTRANGNMQSFGNTFYQMVQTPLKVFICPSDTGFSQNHLLHPDRKFPNSGDIAVSNYVGVEGHFDATSARIAPTTQSCSTQPGNNTGVMWGDSYCRMADVIDGSSNTMMFGERESLIGRGASWLGVYNPGLTFPATNNPQLGPSLVVGNSQPKLNQIEDLQNSYPWNQDRTASCIGFSSLHPNGAQFAFCDGSVRWINTQINHRWASNCGPLAPGATGDEKLAANGVYQRLMNRSDKLPIPGDY